jgi:transcriptional regulator with XRE-family HTH domain
MSEVSAKIRAMREQSGLSQTEAAARLGLTTSGYAFFEQGKRTVGLHYFLQLPDIFGCSMADLLPSSLVLPSDVGRYPDKGLRDIVTRWPHLSTAQRRVIESAASLVVVQDGPETE